jgi:rubrerythrin
MIIPFNADEVFEMAEQIERNGGKFYRAAAEKFPAVRDILLTLAAMEDKHEKTFADMRAELSGTELQEAVFDPDEQAQMYLRAMADGHVFDIKTDPAEKLANKDTPEEVLKMAIGAERDSIAFYVGMKDAVSNRAGKDKVDDIIKEEMSHIVILTEKLQDLK